MSRHGWTLVLILGLAGTSRGDGLSFVAEYRDLGRIEASGDWIEEFPFRVTGSAPVEILDIKGSCGCISPKLSQRRYQPGQEDRLVFGIHTTSQAQGKKRYQVSLTYRQAGGITTKTIIIDMDLFKPIVVEPSNLLLHVRGKGPLKQTITVTDQRPRPLNIESALATSPRLRPRLLPKEKNDPAVRQVELVIDGDFPVGTSEEQLVIRTADARNAEIVIPVTVVRSSRIKILPEVLQGRISGRRLPSWQVLVSDARGKLIRLEGVTSTVPGLEIEYPRATTPRCRLRVALTSEVAAPIDGEVIIRVVEPIITEMRIPIRVDGGPSRTLRR